MSNNELYIKSVHHWVLANGMNAMPADVVEWFLARTEPDFIVDYSEEDTNDELNLLDSYEETEYSSEDRENSQQLALELMEKKYELE